MSTSCSTVSAVALFWEETLKTPSTAARNKGRTLSREKALKTSGSSTTTLRNWSVNVLQHPDKRRSQDRRHFHQEFRQLRPANQRSHRDVLEDDLGHFNNLLGKRYKRIDKLEHIHQLFHHQRRRRIESQEQRGVDSLLHSAPLNPPLRPDASEAVRPRPGGRWLVVVEKEVLHTCRLGGGVLLLVPTLRLLPPSVSVELSGAKTRQGPGRSTAAHAAKQHAVVAPPRRWAAPVTGCQLISIRKGDANKKNGHAWDRRLVVVFQRRVEVCNVYVHQVQQHCNESLRLIYMGQCLHTDPHHHHHTCCQPREPRKYYFQVSKCEQRTPGLRAEASAEHASPFCVRTETEHLRIRVHFAVENVYSY